MEEEVKSKSSGRRLLMIRIEHSEYARFLGLVTEKIKQLVETNPQDFDGIPDIPDDREFKYRFVQDQLEISTKVCGEKVAMTIPRDKWQHRFPPGGSIH